MTVLAARGRLLTCHASRAICHPVRLMAVAHDEFAEFGIAGTRLDRIAEKAGVNKQRIYGLFGDNEALFEVVITEAMDNHRRCRHAGEKALGYFASIYDLHAERPELLRLLMCEALYYPRAVPCPARTSACTTMRRRSVR